MDRLEHEPETDTLDIDRLRREYARLPKTAHGAQLQETHPEVLQEWVTHIIERPYEQWEEYVPHRDEVRTVLVGCVPGFNQWIKVVLVGRETAGALHTAYPDRQMEKRYGGRPWSNLP
jgi:hypothetical protein